MPSSSKDLPSLEPSSGATTNSAQGDPGASSSWMPSWFASPSALKDRFSEFDDKQRIDRLSACRDLDRILRDCRERHQEQEGKGSKTKKNNLYNSSKDPIESVSIGLRNMKYFGWRGILSKKEVGAPSNDSGKTKKQETAETTITEPDLSVFHPKIRSSCAREEHAVWACRAVATGCGKNLSELKKCFEEVDNTSSSGDDESSLPQHIRVLTSPYTNYQGIVERFAGGEGTSDNKDNGATLQQIIPCHEIQRRLGSCVTVNGRDLLERKQQREGQRLPHRS